MKCQQCYKYLFISIVIFNFFSFSIKASEKEYNNKNVLSINIYFDKNKNGKRDLTEWGSGGHKIFINEKSYFTDDLGKSSIEYFSESLPQYLAISLEKGSFPQGTIYTTKHKFNFTFTGGGKNIEIGVFYQLKKISLDVPKKLSLLVNSYFVYKDVKLEGSVRDRILKINGAKEVLPLIKTFFSKTSVINKDAKDLVFKVQVSETLPVKKWKFIIFSENGNVVYQDRGDLHLPPLIRWNGYDGEERKLIPNTTYYYQFAVIFSNYLEAWSPVSYFTVADKELYKFRLNRFDIESNKTSSKLNKFIKDIKALLKPYHEIKINLYGNKFASTNCKNILVKAGIDRTVIQETRSLKVPSGGVTIEVLRYVRNIKQEFQDKIIVNKEKFELDYNGKFYIHLRNVPSNKALYIDIYSKDGSRWIASPNIPEAEILQNFNYRNIKKEFQNVATTNTFQFNYPISGSYSSHYKLLNKDGKEMDNNVIHRKDKIYDVNGVLLDNRLDTLIHFIPEIGMDDYPFTLKTPKGRKISLVYRIESEVAKACREDPYLQLFLPSDYQSISRQYLMIAGFTCPEKNVFVGRREVKTDRGGKFFLRYNLTEETNNQILIALKDKSKKVKFYHVPIIINKKGFLEKFRIDLLVALGYLKLSSKLAANKQYESDYYQDIFSQFTLFPFYNKQTFLRYFGLEVSYSRAIFPINLSDVSGRDLRVKGPESLNLACLFDGETFFEQFYPILSIAYKKYDFNIYNNSFAIATNKVNTYQMGLNLIYKWLQLKFRLNPEIAFYYGFGNGNATSYSVLLALKMQYYSSWIGYLSYINQYYANKVNSLDVKEHIKGLQLGVKLVF